MMLPKPSLHPNNKGKKLVVIMQEQKSCCKAMVKNDKTRKRYTRLAEQT